MDSQVLGTLLSWPNLVISLVVGLLWVGISYLVYLRAKVKEREGHK